MERRQKASYFFAGIMAAFLIVHIAVPAMAVAGKTITVYPGVGLYLDDTKLIPKDANGNPVEVFYYNGTTYVPIRAVSEAFGYPVQWDGDTRSVYIGRHTGDKPAVWLCDIDYFDKSGDWSLGKTTTDNLGQEHTHSVDLTNWGGNNNFIKYKLNGKYVHLSGQYYQKYEYRDSSHGWGNEGYVLSIYADGEQIWKASVKPGIDPVSIDLNIEGVNELEFRYGGYGYSNITKTALGDVGLWT